MPTNQVFTPNISSIHIYIYMHTFHHLLKWKQIYTFIILHKKLNLTLQDIEHPQIFHR